MGCFRSFYLNRIYVVISEQYIGMIKYYINKRHLSLIDGCNDYNYILNIAPELEIQRIDEGWNINGYETPYLPIVYILINMNTFTTLNIVPIVAPGLHACFVSMCVHLSL